MTNTHYNTHPEDATPNRLVVERQLGWAVKTLRNPKLRPAERRCLLLVAGEILVGFLAQDHLESST